jgi:ATP-dependent protease HslVU (ClpYQ) ATPase subunit
MDSFIKDEIETKGIVIIDEIDKLVSNQNSSNISEASVSAEGV